MAGVFDVIEASLETLELLTETTDLVDAAMAGAETLDLIGGTLEGELTTVLDTTLETTIDGELDAMISQTIEENIIGPEIDQIVEDTVAAESEAAVEGETAGETTAEGQTGGESEAGAGEGEGNADDPDSTAGEDGKTQSSMFKVIKKWLLRIVNTYMIVDLVGKKIMEIVEAAKGGNDDGATKLSSEDLENLTALSNAVQQISIIYKSLKESVDAINQSTEFLGNEIVTNDSGAKASVKNIMDSILTNISQQIKICQDVVSRSPFTSGDITDLGDAVYQVIVSMNTLFGLKAKSKVLTTFDVPTEDNRTTLNGILKLNIVTSEDTSISKIKEIQAIIEDPTVQAQAKTAAISAAKDVVYTDIVSSTKDAAIKKYKQEAEKAASNAAKIAGNRVAGDYQEKISEASKAPFGAGALVVLALQKEEKPEVQKAAKNAAQAAVNAYFKSSSLKKGIADLAKEESTKCIEEKHDQIVLAANEAIKTSIQASLKAKSVTQK